MNKFKAEIKSYNDRNNRIKTIVNKINTIAYTKITKHPVFGEFCPHIKLAVLSDNPKTIKKIRRILSYPNNIKINNIIGTTFITLYV